MADIVHIVESGIYQITNVDTQKAVDLAGYDSRSVIGYPPHKGNNQQWEFTPLGHGYRIRSIYNGSYLTAEEGIFNGADLVANQYPVSWMVTLKDEEKGLYEITWPNSSLVIELSKKQGDGSHGKARLGRRTEGDRKQVWHLVPKNIEGTPVRPSTQRQSDISVKYNGPAQATAKTTADTVIDTESFQEDIGGEGEMLITTTTTTVTTTVTKVQKVKASEAAKILGEGYNINAETDFEVVN